MRSVMLAATLISEGTIQFGLHTAAMNKEHVLCP